MTLAWPDELFSPASTATAVLRSRDGALEALPLARWHGEPTVEELDALGRTAGAVLDVGCGPGRHVAALIGAGREALGIDVSAQAVRTTRGRGGRAVQTSVFGPVPDPGRWGSALLLDGNLGLGGDATALLRRIRDLLGPPGLVLVELQAPGMPTGARTVRVEHGDHRGPWFCWEIVDRAAIGPAATSAGFDVEDLWVGGGRHFAMLRARPGPGART